MPIMLVVLLLGALPLAAYAQGGWLDDQTPMEWSASGSGVPTPPVLPSGAVVDPRCAAQQRPPETAEDQQAVDAGWMLIGDYNGGWGIKTILGASFFDGMCRPLNYQVFVFADGLFAGTVSPITMDSRTDGAAVQTLLQGPSSVMVVFTRYSDTDALCCPSRTSTASYQIDRSSGQPTLVLTSVSTNPTSTS